MKKSLINYIYYLSNTNTEKSTTIALVLLIGVLGLTIISLLYFLTKNGKKEK